MKKVFNDTALFGVLGFKKAALTLAVCLSLGVGLLSTAQAAPARNNNPPSLKANAPNVYIVKKGDTLWDISKRFLNNPLRWREIWASNKHVKNPHWIFPGDRLLMCTYEGRPILGKDEGDGCAGIIQRYLGGSSLHPQVRVESLNHAIPIIALDHIQHFLERSHIVSPDALEMTPYIVGTADQRVLAAKGQTVYARGIGLESGQRYAIYREGEAYTALDEHGRKYPLALELTQVATAISSQVNADITTLEITDTYNYEVRRGDRVLPIYDPMLPTLFYPVEADSVTANGQVIRVQGSIGTAAQGSVITVDRGSEHGVETGHVFALSQKGEVVSDPKTKERIQLPGQRIGHVMIFKAFDQFSYGYVLDSALPIKLGAQLLAPNANE